MSLSLYRAYLCPAPAEDKRPEAYSAAVLERVIKPHLYDLAQWLQFRAPTVSEEAAHAAVLEAIQEGSGDAFRAASILRAELNWPSDYALVNIINSMIVAIPVAKRHEERNWAVRTGVRFPAKIGDTVEWYDHNGRRLTGDVLAVDNNTASATCEPKTGLVRSNNKVRVFAESVTINRTNPEFKRVVGFQVEATGDQEKAS